MEFTRIYVFMLGSLFENRVFFVSAESKMYDK